MTDLWAPFLCEERALAAGGLLVRLGGEERPATLAREALRALGEALAAWESRPKVRWIAFASAHPTTFLAGADFRQLRELTPLAAAPFAARGQDLFARMRRSRLWLVALVQGSCTGGGLDFALACDYRIATAAARFSHPGTRLGFFTGWGGTASLPARGGAGISALLAGEAVAARDALRLGWIEEVCPEPLARAGRRARQSAGVDLAAVKALRVAADLPLSLRLPFARRIAEQARAAREERR